MSTEKNTASLGFEQKIWDTFTDTTIRELTENL